MTPKQLLRFQAEKPVPLTFCSLARNAERCEFKESEYSLPEQHLCQVTISKPECVSTISLAAVETVSLKPKELVGFPTFSSDMIHIVFIETFFFFFFFSHFF